MTEQGWFADLTDQTERDTPHTWQPFLQLDGLCLPLPVWFATRDECEEFIRTRVIGKLLIKENIW